MLIQSKTDPNKKYEVDLIKKTCQCEGFKWRHKCKHLEEAMEYIGQDTYEAMTFIKENNDVVAFVDKFGEAKLKELLIRGEIIEQSGKIIIL